MRRLILPAFLLVLFLGLEFTFLSLAHWQYNRAQSASALMNTPHTIFPITGTWVSPTVSIVQDNQPNPANPSESGWRLLTLFHPEEGRALFVDRGWIDFPPNRLSADNLPCTPTAESPTTLQVELKTYPTQRGWLKGPVNTTDDRIYAFLAPQTHYPNINPTEYLVTTTPTCAATQARLLPTRNPQRHQSYMLQWLGLALVTPILFGSLLWKKRRK